MNRDMPRSAYSRAGLFIAGAACLCVVLFVGCRTGNDIQSNCGTTGIADSCGGTTGDGMSSSLPTSIDGETTEILASSASSSTSMSEAWPECVPQVASNSWFVVGPDQWSAPYEPEKYWPPGHHTATCLVQSTDRKKVPDVDLWNIFIDLEECVDEGDQPIERSLDLAFGSNLLPVPPGVLPGVSVRVNYSVKIWGIGDYQSWYSLRTADTAELLLAAVSDPGPTVAPKVPGEPTLEGWLAPLTATLGPFVCPPETEFSCEDDDSPQRAVLDFGSIDDSKHIVSGTAEVFSGFYIHVGFAGNPDVCDLRRNNNPIEFVMVRD